MISPSTTVTKMFMRPYISCLTIECLTRIRILRSFGLAQDFVGMQINSVFSLVCALMILAGRNASAQVTITEFLAANKKTLADSDGAFSDWVEIHNAGGATVNLNGWYLTDNANNLTKWRFPDATVPANGFILVWVSGKNRVVTGAPLHTSFSLAADGEYLGLILPDGQTVASQYAPTFPSRPRTFPTEF